MHKIKRSPDRGRVLASFWVSDFWLMNRTPILRHSNEKRMFISVSKFKMSYRSYSQAEKHRICQLVEKGHSAKEISEDLRDSY